MPNTRYKIIFDGQIAYGFDREQVKHDLQSLFRISEARVEQLFAERRIVVKSGITEQEADRYVDRMRQAGAIVEVVAMKAPPASPALQPAASGKPGDVHVAPFVFKGNGKEYFGIWIVNILLTIITLGIYSAWAKVRNNQYFYGNTELEGSSFQYLAKPVTILKGRLIALALLVIYSVISALFPIGSLVLLVIFLFATPWIIIRALRFNAINSAYRNVRFDFEGRYLSAMMITLVWPILNVLCLFLLTPMVARKSHQFIVEGTRYGTSAFKWHGTNLVYYHFFGKGLLLAIAFGVAFFAASELISPVLGSVIMVLGYLALFGYFSAGIANLLFNNAELDRHRFESELEPVPMVWIYFTNSLLTVLTLGLYIPWAKVRIARYQASCTSMAIQDDLDGFVAAEKNRTSALGEELGEAFDVAFAPI